MGNRLRGRGIVLAAVGLVLPLLAGCGSAGQSSHRTTDSAAATYHAPAGAVQEARQYLHGWSCSAMSPTSPTAIADDVAANAAGNQFGSGSGASAQADFRPASGKANGQRYAEFQCTKANRRAVLWVDTLGGAWLTMNGGFAAPAGLSQTATRISIPASSRSSPGRIENALEHSLSNAFASSSASVSPACALSNKQENDYFCVVANSSTSASAIVLYQVDMASGKVVSLSAGATSAGEQAGGTSTASAGGTDVDSYRACSDTVASAKAMRTDLRMYLGNQTNVTQMHDDFEALGLDLGLLARQVESSGQDSNGVILQNSAAAYLADAEEVDSSGQLQSPPGGFAAALRASCPHSFVAAGLTAGGSPSGADTTTSEAPTQTTTSQGAGSVSCPGTYLNGLVIDVAASGLPCTVAASVVSAWAEGGEPSQVHGFACRFTRRPSITSSGGQNGLVVCSDQGERITLQTVPQG